MDAGNSDREPCEKIEMRKNNLPTHNPKPDSLNISKIIGLEDSKFQYLFSN